LLQRKRWQLLSPSSSVFLQKRRQQQTIILFYFIFFFNMFSFFLFLLFCSFSYKELLIVHQNWQLTMIWWFY
jgi:hypothetical protein